MDLRLKSRRSIAHALALTFALGCGPAMAAEEAYITDVLNVPLHSGPSNDDPILNDRLPSGTALEVLDHDAVSGFSQVRTTSGTEGWISAQYLVDVPIARDQLIAANREVERLNELRTDRQSELDGVTLERDESRQFASSLQLRVTESEKELADIKHISADAIDAHATSERLAELNERLRDEVASLVQELDALQDNVEQQWLLIGAGLVLLGLALGVVIKARPRRSAWN